MAHLTLGSSTQITGSPFLKVDKGKSHVVGSRSTSVSFSIPSNFMIDDTIDTSKIFPHLGKYLPPSQQERFKDATIEDIDASNAGLSFLVSPCRTTFFLPSVLCLTSSFVSHAFQSSLALHSKLESIKRLSSEALKQEDRAVRRQKATIEQGKAIQARYEASKVKVDDLKSELEAADQVLLELVDRLRRAHERIDAQDGELREEKDEK